MNVQLTINPNFESVIPPMTTAELVLLEDNILADGKVLMLRLVGNGFIYKMVRLLTGGLVKVGQGKLSVAEFGRLLAEPAEQPPAPAAPAQGLYLWRLNYEADGAPAVDIM